MINRVAAGDYHDAFPLPACILSSQQYLPGILTTRAIAPFLVVYPD